MTNPLEDTASSPPISADLKDYFLQLLRYAKFIITLRPNLVPFKTISSAWSKENWESIIIYGRSHQITLLPNASSIDLWLNAFREYSQIYFTANNRDSIPFMKFDLKPATPTGDDPAFEALLVSCIRLSLNRSPLSTTSKQSAYTTTPTTVSDDFMNSCSNSSSSTSSSATTPAKQNPSQRATTKHGLITTSSAESSSVLDQIGSSVHKMMRSDTKTTPKPRTLLKSAQPTILSTPKNLKSLFQPLESTPIGRNTVYSSPKSQLPIPQAPPVGSIDLVKHIASGGQGSVFLGRLHVDSTSLVVVKVFFKPPNDSEIAAMRAMALTNFSIRRLGDTRISREQIVKFKKVLEHDGVDFKSFRFDVADDCLAGWCFERLHSDLERVLLDETSKPLGNALKQLIGLQIAYFVRGIHKTNYVFRDLKPSNVLLCVPVDQVTCQQVVRFFLDQTPVIKVADYGLVTREKRSKMTRSAGTVGYMPITQITTDNYGKSVDVTAYCVTVCELFTNDLLYHQEDRDSEVEEEFLTFEVAERAKKQLLRHKSYIPSTLIELIHTTLSGKNASIEPFIQFFEMSLKYLMFSMDTTRAEMDLLNQPAISTPYRPR